MPDHREARDDVIAAVLAKELVGPWPFGEAVDLEHVPRYTSMREAQQSRVQSGTGEEILTLESPTIRYGVGVLYPGGASGQREAELAAPTVDVSDDPDDLPPGPPSSDLGHGGASADEASDDDMDIGQANQFMPSAMGLTFMLDASSTSALEVLVTGGAYTRMLVEVSGSKRGWAPWWVRHPVEYPVLIPGDDLQLADGRVPVLCDPFVATWPSKLQLEVQVYVRRAALLADRIVTVCVVNRSAPRGSVDDLCLFQCSLSVRGYGPAGLGSIVPYPSRRLCSEAEEASDNLLYRDRRTYAIGHGCAADWSEVVSDRVASVFGRPLPAVSTPSTTADIRTPDGAPITVSMLEMSRLDSDPSGFQQLHALADAYSRWIESQWALAAGLGAAHQSTAARHLKECEACCQRIRDGIEYLAADATAKAAFALANRAMLLQQQASRAPERSPAFHASAQAWVFTPPYCAPSSSSCPDGIGHWRAFQIAFLLAAVRSTVAGDDEHRETVELIWFPTGGGKTEAYLGLSAFAMFHRRLTDPADCGLEVMMRYTLRLLTAQQFQRASALICAMEMVRRGYGPQLGQHPFRIGMWVGGGASPNTRGDATAALSALRKKPDAPNPFVVLNCPWCGAAMGRADAPKLPKHMHGILGYAAARGTVIYQCPDRHCPFRDELPLVVVDEDIYEQPPSMLIGTVDKFAQLAWRPEARALFGLGTDGQRVARPPGLVLQDELHLISGPLGSMVGLLEPVVERLCTDLRGGVGRRPKIVCATATIRRHGRQILDLYGRPKASLFPPPGLSADDSFFAVAARDDAGRLLPGRLYMGVHAPSLRSMQTVQVRAFSALLLAPCFLPEDARDPWWTLLSFFNSLRELGTTLTLLQSDIPDRLKVLRRRLGLTADQTRWLRSVWELTARLESDGVPVAMKRLKEPYGAGKANRAQDVCLASSMIEVGIDIDRLSLMAVVGQPKSTAQYIQVSGRVGRRWWERPGLVVTLYNHNKPRDRSHFERFRSYHDCLYAQVEPTSVTPFSPPAIERALHATMVAYVRQSGGMAAAASPTDVPPELWAAARDTVLARVHAADPAELTSVARVADRRIRQWRLWDNVAWRASYGDTNVALLRASGSYASRAQALRSWATPTSLRHVDAECLARITTAYWTGDDADE